MTSDKSFFQALTRGIQDGHDNDGLSFTVVELLEAHKSTAAPILFAMLTAADDETRANAAWALGFVEPEITAGPLLAIMSDPAPSVRSAAAPEEVRKILTEEAEWASGIFLRYLRTLRVIRV